MLREDAMVQIDSAGVPALNVSNMFDMLCEKDRGISGVLSMSGSVRSFGLGSISGTAIAKSVISNDPRINSMFFS